MRSVQIIVYPPVFEDVQGLAIASEEVVNKGSVSQAPIDPLDKALFAWVCLVRCDAIRAWHLSVTRCRCRSPPSRNHGQDATRSDSSARPAITQPAPNGVNTNRAQVAAGGRRNIERRALSKRSAVFRCRSRRLNSATFSLMRVERTLVHQRAMPADIQTRSL